jgi:hypothetical protein
MMPRANPRFGRSALVKVIKTEEKGSDVNLATYLLTDAFRGDCEVQVVITNDSDLREPIRIIKDELQIPVGVVNPHPQRKRSRAIQGSFFKQIGPGVIAKCQSPVTLKDASGAFRSRQVGDRKRRGPRKAGLAPSDRSPWGDWLEYYIGCA